MNKEFVCRYCGSKKPYGLMHSGLMDVCTSCETRLRFIMRKERMENTRKIEGYEINDETFPSIGSLKLKKLLKLGCEFGDDGVGQIKKVFSESYQGGATCFQGPVIEHKGRSNQTFVEDIAKAIKHYNESSGRDFLEDVENYRKFRGFEK